MISFPLQVASYQLGTNNVIQSFEGDRSNIITKKEYVEGRKWKLKITLPRLDFDKQRIYSAFQADNTVFKFNIPKVSAPVNATASSATQTTVTFSNTGSLVVGDLFTMNDQLLKITSFSSSIATVYPYVHNTDELNIASSVYGIFFMTPEDNSVMMISAHALSPVNESKINITAEEYYV